MRRGIVAASLVLTASSYGAQAQDAQQRRNTLWVSPAELFYKVQAGYERSLSPTYSLGIQGAVYRNTGVWNKFAGWHLSLLGRSYFRSQAPFGFYAQAQVSLYAHEQVTDMTPIDNQRYGYEVSSYRWTGVGAGAGVGIGCRLPVFAKALQHHLTVDAMLGGRLNWRPRPQFDHKFYREAQDYVPAGVDWYILGPGSLVHGGLNVGYTF